MATIETRTTDSGEKSYRVKVRLKGYPAQSATFDRLTDAKKWAAATESAIREGRHFKTAEAKKHTVGEMLTRYYSEVLPHYNEKEQKERKSKLEWWRQAIGHCLLADVTPAAITEHKAKMTQSAATVDKYLKNLSHAFTVAVNDWGWLEDNPVKKVKSPKLPRGRVRFLDDDERQRFLTACQQSSNPTLYLCVILALSTGMRQGELMGLKWQDVNLKDGFIILHETKNGERRRVPLAGHGLELLRDHAKVRRLDTDLLFPGNIHANKPIDLRKPFEKALQAAQINDFHWHDLRHCTASYLAMNGASLAEIAEVLGHKTLAMVKRYAHLSDGHVSNVVASMNAKIFGGV
ncbi:tyrosine-type recombinase/integrase [Methylomonas koyamae]|uniref:tyrosine-type recombinase/integrase n=1 Tax=Methylomonas koyamae TaxID=702114 RepID=UPI000BC36507|nr:site-specific integrase [Methylomonas koyamae]ATG89137.1 integrase [Methylomonas koyamae]